MMIKVHCLKINYETTDDNMISSVAIATMNDIEIQV